MINDASEVFHFVFICTKCHGIPHEVWNLYHSVAQNFKMTSLKLVTTNQLTAVDAVTVFVVKKNRNSEIKKKTIIAHPIICKFYNWQKAF